MPRPETDSLESGKAAAQREADSLQEQLTELITKAGELEADLIETGEKILGAQEDLEKAQEKADEQYESMSFGSVTCTRTDRQMRLRL